MRVLIEVDYQLILNALQNGVISSWGDYASTLVTEDMMWNEGKPISIVEFEWHKNLRLKQYYELTREKVEKAVVVIWAKYPWHYENIVTDNADADTGDVLIQVAIFGDIIYS
jgi:hypothetical protein